MKSALFLATCSAILAAITPFAVAVPVSNVIPHNEIVENAAKGLRLLSLAEDTKPVWKTEDEVFDLIRNKKQFFDVTETYEQDLKNAKMPKQVTTLATYPTTPSHQTQVKAIIATLKTSNMQSDLTKLTSYNNRYYKSTTGVDSSNWILSTVKTIASGRSDITVVQFNHSWAQSSVIVKFAGSTNPSGPITILGAHQDSINQNSPSTGRAPGADDNGSGSVGILETYRQIVASGFKPSSPLEFHWYAGEEVGLLGSQAIASSYKSAGKQVRAVFNLDMIAYFQPGSPEVIALEQDYIDTNLNTFLKSLISTYNSIPAGTDICNYACSDHASWYNQGYPAAMPFEAPTVYENPDIHTTADTMTHTGFSWTHALEFVKLAVAFVVELTA
jgi:leucyl aminopeptidase